MSRRARAVAFLLVALLAAALAAAIADGYGDSVASGYGVLRPVAVAATEIPAGRAIVAADLTRLLASRRVPARFVPVGALRGPAEAVGLVPTADLPVGSYLLAGQLRPPGSQQRRRPRFGRGRHPVEILVSGATALLAAGPLGERSRVDVVVTTEPAGSGPGRTYVAAAAVPLLALAAGGEGQAAGEASAATLALTRDQALRLIAAQSFARRITLLPRG
jgi:Flp pilus assembly protein CpaB